MKNDMVHVNVVGNYLYWTGDTSHLAANLGMEDRYTMQITATLKTWQKEEQ